MGGHFYLEPRSFVEVDQNDRLIFIEKEFAAKQRKRGHR